MHRLPKHGPLISGCVLLLLLLTASAQPTDECPAPNVQTSDGYCCESAALVGIAAVGVNATDSVCCVPGNNYTDYNITNDGYCCPIEEIGLEVYTNPPLTDTSCCSQYPSKQLLNGDCCLSSDVLLNANVSPATESMCCGGSVVGVGEYLVTSDNFCCPVEHAGVDRRDNTTASEICCNQYDDMTLTAEHDCCPTSWVHEGRCVILGEHDDYLHCKRHVIDAKLDCFEFCDNPRILDKKQCKERCISVFLFSDLWCRETYLWTEESTPTR